MCGHVDDGVDVGLWRNQRRLEMGGRGTYEGHSGEVPENDEETPPNSW